MFQPALPVAVASLGFVFLLVACGPSPNSNPAASPSASPAASASPTVSGRVWTDAEVDAAMACFGASSNSTAKLVFSSNQFRLKVIRDNRQLMGPQKYQVTLNTFGNELVASENTLKLGCVK